MAEPAGLVLGLAGLIPDIMDNIQRFRLGRDFEQTYKTDALS